MKKHLKYVLYACLVIVLHFGGVATLKADTNVPMLKEVKQIAPNKLQVTYDKQPDMTKATDPSNYWIQSLEAAQPTGIATLGKDQKVNAGNALTAKKVKITPISFNGADTQVLLTFKENITPGAKYKMIICYVSVPGGGQYDGDNGAVEFVGQ